MSYTFISFFFLLVISTHVFVMKIDKILHHDITEILLKVALNTINQANLDEIQIHFML